MDWAAVNWVNVGLLSAFAFLAALIGGVLSFNRRLLGAILTALLFGRRADRGIVLSRLPSCFNHDPRTLSASIRGRDGDH
jgi:hypothetical protein